MSLITKKQIEEFKKLHEPEILIRNIGRQTGRTTRMALATLLHALDNLGKEITVKDHHGTKHATLNMLYVMKEMAVNLNLDYMRFDDQKLTVLFDWRDSWDEVKLEK